MKLFQEPVRALTKSDQRMAWACSQATREPFMPALSQLLPDKLNSASMPLADPWGSHSYSPGRSHPGASAWLGAGSFFPQCTSICGVLHEADLAHHYHWLRKQLPLMRFCYEYNSTPYRRSIPGPCAIEVLFRREVLLCNSSKWTHGVYF